MPFDVSKAMREGDPDRELSAEEWARALAPVRRAREQLLEATRSLNGQLVAETYIATGEAFIYVAMSRLMVRRLVRS